MWHRYINATNIEEVIKYIDEMKDKARIIAGGTDLLLEMERGVRAEIDTLIDISRIPGLDRITLDEDGFIHLGPMVTHNHCVSSKLLRENAAPLVMACWEVGSPQIRNRGTIAGNLITASPANDTISPLMGLRANLVLKSQSGERTVQLDNFYTGVRKTVMRSDEILVDIIFPALTSGQIGIFKKHALRKAQAISLINFTMILSIEKNTIKEASITLGAVAPTIIHASEAEQYLIGKFLSKEVIQIASELIEKATRPITDVRSSDVYRRKSVLVLSRRALESILKGEIEEIPKTPILLWGREENNPSILGDSITHDQNVPICTSVNGINYEINTGQGKTLLRFLREEVKLTGTKEGCAEGECGACTVFMDGIAVMSCLIPAPRAHGAKIITVEGLSQGGELHPVQAAFVKEGAVQCGYCTPGFVMSAVKLLEENSHPTTEQIKQAITGNLCRCTGYYKIIQAIEHASDPRR